MLLETTPSVHNRTYQLDQRGGGGRVQAKSYIYYSVCIGACPPINTACGQSLSEKSLAQVCGKATNLQ